MPDDESQESTSGILFVQKNRIRLQRMRSNGQAFKAGTQENGEESPTPVFVLALDLFLDP
jgi:hypothetical protein